MPYPVASVRNKGSNVSFSPLDVPGLGLWLDFSDASTMYQTNDTSTPVTADGQTIGYIADKSGNSRQATQGTSGLRPLYKTNRQNSKSGALYDGSDDVLNTASFALNQPCTYVFVAKWNGTIGSGRAFFDGVSNRNQVWVAGGPRINIYAGSTINGTFVPVSGTTYIISVIFNGASSNSWINGAADIVNQNAGAVNINAGLQIGFSSTITFIGDYYELLAFSGALSSAARGQVEAYLNTKWAVF